MNRMIYTILLAGTFCLGLASLGVAQGQKIGYVDTDFILSQMPEYQGLEQRLQQLSREWRAELKQMQQEIDRLKEDFEAKEILFTDDVRKQRQEEINNKIQQREQYLDQKFGPEGEYFQRQKELLEPIQRKVFEAISSVARREGYDFVFDKANKTDIMYSRQEWNLNDEVLTELGIEVNETSN